MTRSPAAPRATSAPPRQSSVEGGASRPGQLSRRGPCYGCDRPVQTSKCPRLHQWPRQPRQAMSRLHRGRDLLDGHIGSILSMIPCANTQVSTSGQAPQELLRVLASSCEPASAGSCCRTVHAILPPRRSLRGPRAPSKFLAGYRPLSEPLSLPSRSGSPRWHRRRTDCMRAVPTHKSAPETTAP